MISRCWCCTTRVSTKQGRHSVGVSRQYSGTLGRTANCQVGVSLHLAGELGSACLGMRLYLPEEWTRDRERCHKAGVPEDVLFRRKWENALGLLLDDAHRWGVAKRLLLLDAGYAAAHAFLAPNRALFPPARQALDPADGAQAASARPAAADRVVPALSSARRRSDTRSRPVEAVIE